MCGRGEADNRREPKWGGSGVRLGRLRRMADTVPACGGERCRACAGVTQAYAAGELCSRVANREWGGGGLWCMWATEGTPGSRRVAGAKIRYWGRNFATVGKFLPCSSFSP